MNSIIIILIKIVFCYFQTVYLNQVSIREEISEKYLEQNLNLKKPENIKLEVNKCFQ